MLNISIRRKARQLGRLVRTTALTPVQGQSHQPLSASANELGVTFIGHSSFFVQFVDLNVAVDPNFARWLVVLKRLRRPGVRLRDLPAMDYILVSHAHMDHLHRPSLRALARAARRISGVAPVVVVPAGVGDLVSRLGFREVVELNTWQEYRHNGTSITLTPARHWGARMLRDHHRGFGGYVIRRGEHSVYHAGDTAYFSGFKEIGARLRPELALLPIGAYHPPSFRNVHMSPEDALQAFADLGAHYMMPMHYGTFRLSQEPMHEPVERLMTGATARGIEERVFVLDEGRTRIFPGRSAAPPPSRR
jgi:L-ascorbate metabolism protein UlaG (beta-lactamase superfamily)